MPSLARKVLGHAREIGVVLRPEVVDAQDRLVVPDLRDADPGGDGLRQEQLVVSVPLQGQREVAVRHGAQHGHSLAEPQMLTHCELIDGGRDCFRS